METVTVEIIDTPGFAQSADFVLRNLSPTSKFLSTRRHRSIKSFLMESPLDEEEVKETQKPPIEEFAEVSVSFDVLNDSNKYERQSWREDS